MINDVFTLNEIDILTDNDTDSMATSTVPNGDQLYPLKSVFSRSQCGLM